MKKTTKVWLTVAVCLAVTGNVVFLAVMASCGWDFTKLSTISYQTTSCDIDESFDRIAVNIDIAHLRLLPSSDGQCRVTCYQEINRPHTVTVADNTLCIEATQIPWWQQIGISFDSPKITVYLPQRDYQSLTVSQSTGDIDLQKLTAKTLDLTTSTGHITVTDVTCAGDANLQVTTGKTTLTNLTCRNLITKGSTGDLICRDTLAACSFGAQRSTGNVTLTRCDGQTLSIRTDTGNVSGSLLTDKVFLARSDTGRINLPKTLTGGKCEINTDTGNIEITIAQ